MRNIYITEVELHNYRGFKHSVIPITPGLNVIYGEGDAGKSALEKALGWCLYDAKQGKFINKGITTNKGKIKSKEEVYVQTTFSTGDIIRRGADSTTPNLYWIGKVGVPFEEWGDPIKNFKDVPEDVRKIINIGSVNIGKQFDSHFLLSSKGSEIARDLNKMVNLEIIDSSQSNAKHFVTKIKREKGASEFNLAKYEKDLESYSYLEAMKVSLEIAEEVEKDIVANKESQREVGVLLNTLDESDEKMGKFKSILLFKTQVEALQELTNKVDSLSIERETVKSTLSQIAQNGDLIAKYKEALQFKEVVSSIAEIESKVTEIRNSRNTIASLLDSSNVEIAVCHNEQIIDFKKDVERVLELTRKIDELNKEYGEIEKLLDSIDDNKNLIREKESELVELRKNLKGVCPTCGRAFNECEEVL